MQARASIVVIGDEILDGHTRDTNSGWLAACLAGKGVAVDRIVTVPDTHAAIDEALDGELARGRPRLVATSGGIGSTPDDLTMEAVAAHLGIGLTMHPELAARIDRWAQAAEDDGTPIGDAQLAAMRRMAQVPEGAYLLEGTRGVTPGVALDLGGGVEDPDGATLVILPGVPQEFVRIAEQGLELLLERIGAPVCVREVRHPYPESLLSPLLRELQHDHPHVSVGSYPGRECVLRMKGPFDEVARVERRVRAYLDALASDATAARLSVRWQARWE